MLRCWLTPVDVLLYCWVLLGTAVLLVTAKAGALPVRAGVHACLKKGGSRENAGATLSKDYLRRPRRSMSAR